MDDRIIRSSKGEYREDGGGNEGEEDAGSDERKVGLAAVIREVMWLVSSETICWRSRGQEENRMRYTRVTRE